MYFFGPVTLPNGLKYDTAASSIDMHFLDRGGSNVGVYRQWNGVFFGMLLSSEAEQLLVLSEPPPPPRR